MSRRRILTILLGLAVTVLGPACGHDVGAGRNRPSLSSPPTVQDQEQTVAAPPAATSPPPAQPAAPTTPTPSAPTRGDSAPPAGGPGLGSWSNERLAAQLVFAGLPMSDEAGMRTAAAAGVGGIALFGSPVPNLRAELAHARQDAAAGIAPFVASDEEGGDVQRLARILYPLPSARTMGSWTPATITTAARDYGREMSKLGVDMDFAPDADLSVPGGYIAELGRSFSVDPGQVAQDVQAWLLGLDQAGVLGVVKHWPGHGRAPNTHNSPAVIPPLPVLAGRDLIPFEAAFAAGHPAVMVGHLQVPGLTAPGTPASESAAAIGYLRGRAKPDTLIVTDDLGMAAASSALGITPAEAAVRALQAGTDMAVDRITPFGELIRTIRAAIDTGALPRQRAMASVARILAWKQARPRSVDAQ